MKGADIPRQVAQIALIEQMLLDHGRTRASEPVIYGGLMYRITVEYVPVEDVPAETRRFMQESGHDHERTD